MHDNLTAVNPELMGTALLALEDGDYPGLCEVCWGGMVNGVCSDCLRPATPKWREMLKALWDAIWGAVRGDWREHKRMVAERREQIRLSKVLLP